MSGSAVTTTVTPSTSMNWTRQSAVTARAGADRGWLIRSRYPLIRGANAEPVSGADPSGSRWAGQGVTLGRSGWAGVADPAAQVAVAGLEAVGPQPAGHPVR